MCAVVRLLRVLVVRGSGPTDHLLKDIRLLLFLFCRYCRGGIEVAGGIFCSFLYRSLVTQLLVFRCWS